MTICAGHELPRNRHDAPYEKTMPLFLQAFLPIGPLVVPFNVTMKQWEEASYQHRPAIAKLSGKSVSTRTFLDEDPKFCSVVLHSGVDCEIILVDSVAISRSSTTQTHGLLSVWQRSHGASDSLCKIIA